MKSGHFNYWWFHNILNLLNATELSSFKWSKWLILCYMNLMTIKGGWNSKKKPITHLSDEFSSIKIGQDHEGVTYNMVAREIDSSLKKTYRSYRNISPTFPKILPSYDFKSSHERQKRYSFQRHIHIHTITLSHMCAQSHI